MESQTAKISFKVDGELYERIAEHARAEGLPNMSAAIRDLIEIALDTGSLSDEIEARVEVRFKELENRVAKVCSRGTKASLANLLATSTFASAVASIERANYNGSRRAASCPRAGSVAPGGRLSRCATGSSSGSSPRRSWSTRGFRPSRWRAAWASCATRASSCR
ncbi:MAG: ribbon-helix-helix protein, CopG family [Eggerthellaceae bacterium]|nr:ribbon-helix-helix protein, CopG family [Eggerthellaceae bacterium]